MKIGVNVLITIIKEKGRKYSIMLNLADFVKKYEKYENLSL